MCKSKINRLCQIGIVILCVYCMVIQPVVAQSTELLHSKADENVQKEACKQLEKLGVVCNTEERWDATAPITRRDMFKMAFVAKSGVRRFVEIKDEYDLDFYKEVLNAMVKTRKVDEDQYEDIQAYIVYFDDVEAYSEDDFLSVNLAYDGLLKGSLVNGRAYARLDEYVTYEEALATLIRILASPDDPPYVPYYGDLNFFEAAEEIGLINNQSPFTCGTKRDPITDDIVPYPFFELKEVELSEYITAYDFMYLLRETLYIPTIWFYHYSGMKYVRRIDALIQNPPLVTSDSDIKD